MPTLPPSPAHSPPGSSSSLRPSGTFSVGTPRGQGGARTPIPARRPQPRSRAELSAGSGAVTLLWRAGRSASSQAPSPAGSPGVAGGCGVPGVSPRRELALRAGGEPGPSVPDPVGRGPESSVPGNRVQTPPAPAALLAPRRPPTRGASCAPHSLWGGTAVLNALLVQTRRCEHVGRPGPHRGLHERAASRGDALWSCRLSFVTALPCPALLTSAQGAALGSSSFPCTPSGPVLPHRAWAWTAPSPPLRAPTRPAVPPEAEGDMNAQVWPGPPSQWPVRGHTPGPVGTCGDTWRHMGTQESVEAGVGSAFSCL